jgi:hypothetical protein
VGHVAYKGESRCNTECWFGNLKDGDHVEGKGVDGVHGCGLNSYGLGHVWMWTEFIWFGACVDVD